MIIPTISKENKMSKMKALVGRQQDKIVKFMGEDIVIHKLSVGQVMQIQEASASKDDAKTGLNLLKMVIRLACRDAAELSDEEFDSFAMDDLTGLSNEIMAYSGVAPDTGK
jgi:hypothetical protein